MKTVIARISEGKIKTLDIIETESVGEAIKKVVTDILKEWDPEKHDLIITRHESSEISESSKESVPIYVLSPSSEWVGEELIEKEIITVFPYISEELTNEILRVLSDYSKSR
ncbi:MAG: DUF2286 domain-containing protein [Desulfurococcaceae archaeon TW002]